MANPEADTTPDAEDSSPEEADPDAATSDEVDYVPEVNMDGDGDVD